MASKIKREILIVSLIIFGGLVFINLGKLNTLLTNILYKTGVYRDYDFPSAPYPRPTPIEVECEVVKPTRKEAFSILSSSRGDILADENKDKVALAYEVINDKECGSKIYVDFLKGSKIPVPGIGVGYTENRKILDFDDNRNYWVIGACKTNNRVLIDTETGEQIGPLHRYVYCGGVF